MFAIFYFFKKNESTLKAMKYFFLLQNLLLFSKLFRFVFLDIEFDDVTDLIHMKLKIQYR